MNPSREQFEDLLKSVLVDTPYLTRLERARGGTSIVHIRTPMPVFDLRQHLNKFIGFPISLAFAKQYKRGLAYFRGVDPGKLEYVLNNGLDTNPFFAANSLEKALEYGGNYPLVLVIDPQYVESSFRTILPNVNQHAEKLAKARLEFNSPGIFDEDTGQWLFSHFPETHRSRLTPYEYEYGYRLVGEPRDGLLALLLFEGPSSEA